MVSLSLCIGGGIFVRFCMVCFGCGGVVVAIACWVYSHRSHPICSYVISFVDDGAIAPSHWCLVVFCSFPGLCVEEPGSRAFPLSEGLLFGGPWLVSFRV